MNLSKNNRTTNTDGQKSTVDAISSKKNELSNKPASSKKRYVTLACGHKVPVKSGNTKEESVKNAEKQKDYQLCEECIKKAGYNYLGIAAIMGCRQAHCAVLTGTEKQIMWAEVIRFAHLLALDEYRNLIKELRKDEKSQCKTAVAAIGTTIRWITSITESKWWIENHADNYKSAMRHSGSWWHFRDTIEIIGMAMKLLMSSPSMNSSAASALDMEDMWNDLVGERAKSEARSKALAEAILADNDLKLDLIVRARSLKWHGEIKPWWQDGDSRLFFNDMGNCSICWIGKNFEKTVRFWRMDDSPESRQLAKDVWHWCMSEPNSDKARNLTI